MNKKKEIFYSTMRHIILISGISSIFSDFINFLSNAKKRLTSLKFVDYTEYKS